MKNAAVLLGFILVSSVVFAACSDSDGGLNYFEKGVCKDPYKERTDSCLPGGEVQEFSCSATDKGYCVALNMECGDLEGSTATCRDGACVKLEAEPSPSPSSPVASPSPTPRPSPSPTPAPVAEVVEEKPLPSEALPLWLIGFVVALALAAVYEAHREKLFSFGKPEKSKKEREGR